MKIIQYVGVKQDGETAFSHLTKIERWMIGDTHPIDDALAAKMLQHPDVFAIAGEVKPNTPVAPITAVITRDDTGAQTGAGLADAVPVKGSIADRMANLTGAGELDPALTGEGVGTGTGDVIGGTGTAAEAGSILAPGSAVIPGSDVAGPPEGEAVIQLTDGTYRVLDGMDAESLRELAKSLDIKVAVNAGVVSVSGKLLDAFPIKKPKKAK